MAFNLTSSMETADKVAATGDAAPSVIDFAPPIYYEETTTRVELKDESGTITGYDDVTSGFGYTYTTHYDAELNYIGSEFVDDSGYRSATTQTAQKDEAGNITGYSVESSGGNSDYHYSSHDSYDADWNLIHSTYSDSSGYSAETTQTTLRDAAGNVSGYSIVSTGSGADSNYSSSASYDADWNLIDSTYSDSDGYSSTYVRTTLYDAAGKITGYEATSSGSGDWGSYTSSERLDADYNLLSSEYSDSSGYRSTYAQETEYDSSGAVSGYLITSSWTDGTTSYSSENRYDADWNWVSGTEPPVYDDGPKILPVLTMTTDDQVETVRAATADTDDAAANTVTDTAGAADALQGTSGDDLFILSDRGDSIAANGGGSDTVLSGSLDLKLASHALAGVLNAGLTGSLDLDLVGNGRGNTLSGNAGDNLLNGKGGADTLFGGAGSDSFVLDKRSLKDADTITDFDAGSDVIALSGKVFKELRGLGEHTGQLADGVWGETLRYDSDSGELVFDTNGDAAAGEIVIAIVGEAAGLGAGNFTFV